MSLTTKEINVPIEVTGTITDTVSLAVNTSGDGLVLQNTTAATASNNAFSPRIRLTGFGWKLNATAASEQSDWIIENQPQIGATQPASRLAFLYQNNGGGYATGVQFTQPNAGTITVNLNLNGGASNFQINNTTVLSGSALGSGVTSSNLTSLGTLSSLTCSGHLNVHSNFNGGTQKGSGAFTNYMTLGNDAGSSSGTPQQFGPSFDMYGSAFNGTSSQVNHFYSQVRPINGSGSTSVNFVLSSSINGPSTTPTDNLTLSSAGTLTLGGGFVGGVSTATVAANATTLANDFKSYIIPSNSGTSVAVTGPSAVAGQEMNIINKDSTAATTGIVVPANTCRGFLYDGSAWWPKL
jgi:hypothetical protein